MQKSLGLIETQGLAAGIEAADAAVKSANVELIGYELTKGGGWTTVKIQGDVGAVKAAVDAARMAASKVSRVVSTRVIPRPAAGLDMLVHNPDTVGDAQPGPARESSLPDDAPPPQEPEPETPEGLAPQPVSEEPPAPPAEEALQGSIPDAPLKEGLPAPPAEDVSEQTEPPAPPAEDVSEQAEPPAEDVSEQAESPAPPAENVSKPVKTPGSPPKHVPPQPTKPPANRKGRGKQNK